MPYFTADKSSFCLILTSAKILQDYILRYSEEKQEPLAVECFENGLNFISDYKASCDIALMDIEMPHMNGLDTARKLREFDSQIPLIFITNMAQYAINGYEVQALDFMVKPIEYFNFSLKLDKAIRISHCASQAKGLFRSMKIKIML